MSGTFLRINLPPKQDISNGANVAIWDINKIIRNTKPGNSNYAIIILNRPLSQHQEFMKNFWSNATVRMAVDGGTQEWDKYSQHLVKDSKNLKSLDLITGDFDSITDETLNKYRNKGCKIIHTPDQNFTDFTKGLIELNSYCKQNNAMIDHVIAIGQNSGRIDHVFGNIETLFLAQENEILPQNTRLYLMGDDSLSWLLTPGDHRIVVPQEVVRCKNCWCSLVPIGGTCRNITTSGLKWNLDNNSLKFGKLVSTSNSFDGSEYVRIKCSDTVLWSMKIVS